MLRLTIKTTRKRALTHWYILHILTYLGLLGSNIGWCWNKMAAVLQKTFSNVFSRIKIFVLRFKFHGSLVPLVQLTRRQHYISNGLAPNRRQTITWTDDVQIFWHRHAYDSSSNLFYQTLWKFVQNCITSIIYKTELVFEFKFKCSNSFQIPCKPLTLIDTLITILFNMTVTS